jgi:anionic cell wall polymer biosynthesis LytR-Cps2A-Psr (LCP) family protein
MLSIPRDMWVYIPGFDYGKINTAIIWVKSIKTTGGGPALAVQTV